MSNGPLEIKAISGHAGTVPGRDASRDYQICKVIDVTTCIGCKACEVACLEWNGYPFRETVFDNTYQTMPDLAWNYYNLIRFNEHVADDGTLSWLMRKDGCMHCADPGCLRACPADGAIVQYANGIVDFNQANCIGCQYCVTGCPFNIPKFNSETKKVHKCTLCSDRVGAGLEPACAKACPTQSIQFGPLDELRERARLRVEDLHEAGQDSARLYLDDPADGIGGGGAFFLLLDEPEVYGLPPDPVVTTRDLPGMWKHVAIAAAGLAGAAVALGLGRRR